MKNVPKISIPRIFIKINYNQVQMLITINISSLFLTLKYVKYFCLGQNPKITFQSDLRFSNMSQIFRIKITISIINQE